MKKYKLTMLFFLLALFVNASCKEEKHVPPTWGEDKEEQNKEPNAAVVKSGWKYVEDSYGELPNYINGAGSSGMLVNGKETIKPSDGTQRAVLTAVGLQ